MARPPIHRLAKPELQGLFNRELLPQILCDELPEPLIERSGDPKASIRAQEPPGTKSQMVSYWHDPRQRQGLVAMVHRYLRPDGKLGQSGLPDPKQLVYEGERYALHPNPPERK